MVAFWMIGLADTPDHSAEICVCEISGTDVAFGSARVGFGVHPHQDPAVIDDFEWVEVLIDITTFHDYAAEWSPGGVRFSIDGQPFKTGGPRDHVPDATHAVPLRVPPGPRR